MKFTGSWPCPFLRYIECVETGETVLIADQRFIGDDRPCKLFGGDLVFEGPEPPPRPTFEYVQGVITTRAQL